MTDFGPRNAAVGEQRHDSQAGGQPSQEIRWEAVKIVRGAWQESKPLLPPSAPNGAARLGDCQVAHDAAEPGSRCRIIQSPGAHGDDQRLMKQIVGVVPAPHQPPRHGAQFAVAPRRQDGVHRAGPSSAFRRHGRRLSLAVQRDHDEVGVGDLLHQVGEVTLRPRLDL